MTTGIVVNGIKYRRRPHTESIVWRRSNVRAGVHSRSSFIVVITPSQHTRGDTTPDYTTRTVVSQGIVPTRRAQLAHTAVSFPSPSEFVRFTRRFFYAPYSFHTIRRNYEENPRRFERFSRFSYTLRLVLKRNALACPTTSSIKRNELNEKTTPFPANPKKHRMFQTGNQNTLTEGQGQSHPKRT